MSITTADFALKTEWEIDKNGPVFNCCDIHSKCPKYIVDLKTGKKYLNESPKVIRFKCFWLTLGTPLVHTPAGLVNVAIRTAKVFSGYHFWKSNQCKNRSECIKEVKLDVLKVLAQPAITIGLEGAALYGIFKPYEGRKIYSAFETIAYEDIFRLAPCFRAEPASHLFRGSIDKKDAF